MPKISVIIPTRNRLTLLTRALDSVLAQADVDLEVIVVDDGSSDGTWQMLTTLADPRVRAVHHAQSTGVSLARNAGVEASSSSWIAFLDDDDFWAPHKLSVQLAALSSADANMSFTSAVMVDADERPGFVMRAPSTDRLLVRMVGTNCVGTPSSVIVSRALFDQSGGFDPAFSVLADWDLWLRMLDQGAIAAPCPEPLIAYTRHANNMHLESTLQMVSEFNALRVKHAALGERLGVQFGNIEWSRWIASSHRRAGRRYRAAAAYFETGVRYRASRELARAAGVLLGERALRVGARLRPLHENRHTEECSWLVHQSTSEADGALR